MAFDLAVRGGTLADGSVADLGIAGGIIVQIGGEVQAAAEVDARGKLVLPGGVDAHVHLSNPPRESAGPSWVDDFTSGSAAALAGGIRVPRAPVEQARPGRVRRGSRAGACRHTSRLGRCTCTSIPQCLTGPNPGVTSASRRCARRLT
jgi:imidazolonepropionase-like amidohydrolase